MKLDQLTDGGFEELTYDLLSALGFVNVNWRRGSGLGGATADQGRDIVAQELRKEVDGSEYFATWFVQCKHYVQGVPPEKLQGALAWANSERPDVLLFVLSNFLSNPAKNHLDDYERNNRPPFRLRIWERKDIGRLLSSYPALVRKYGLDPSDSTLTAHPAHAQYVLDPPFNTMSHFFALLDAMEPKMRDDVFGRSYHSVIGPRYRKAKHNGEKIANTMLDAVDFPAFKAKCLQLEAARLSGYFLIRGAVTEALNYTRQFGDQTKVDATIARNRDAIAYFKERLASEADPDKIEGLEGAIAVVTEVIESVHERRPKWYKYYVYLCETLLPALAMEELPRELPDCDA